MSSAEGIVPPLAAAAAAASDPPAATPPRRRLFRKYALLLVGLVGAALLITSGFDFWFSYQETKAALIRLQQEKALAAAERIAGFVDEIQRQIGWTTHAQWAASPLDQRRQDYFRLLRQVPAITEVRQLDAAGQEQLKVSRLAMDATGSGADSSQSPAFLGAKADRLWFSPVYFRKQSEPYVTMAIAHQGRNAGVTVAEINLKLIWDVINDLKIGRGGYAYVVDGKGRLIAHPDISLVLRGTDLSGLSQVAAALATTPTLPSPAIPGSSPGRGELGRGPVAESAVVAENLAGKKVLSAHAPIAPLGWSVFVEAPLSEAFAPLYGAALRTGLLLAGGLAVAILLALVLARRMTGPIDAIAAGAERFGAGDFGRRIEVDTGDELEALAGQFNRMAADLHKSYAELEQRVEERTAELSEALEQQTATAEVLGVINSSPGDLAPVFDAILEKAHSLCGADHGHLTLYSDGHFRAVALNRMPDEFAEMIRRPFQPAHGIGERLLAGEPFVQIEDMAALTPRADDQIGRAAVERGRMRTLLFVPLRKDKTLLGHITAHREEVRPFTDKQIALLQNFAAQAVIAIENARLITETREALEQQTATAEVLQVINSSPGDLAPVFDAMLEKAMHLCEAAFGSLWTLSSDRFRPTAHRGVPAPYAEYLAREVPVAGPGTGRARLLAGEPFAHIVDLANDEPYRAGEPHRLALVDLGGARTALLVPLRKDEAVIGFIMIYRQEVRPFTDKQIALLQNFAAQAVIAMENARLITETHEALEQQTATAEVLGVINASPGDLAPVFDAMLEKATRLCEAPYGLLRIWDGEYFQYGAVHGDSRFSDWVRRRGPFRPDSDDNPLRRILEGERVIQFADARDSTSPRFRQMVEASGIRSGAMVALHKDDALLGTITIYHREVRPFSDKQIALLQNFAAQAVIAIENARLITETREALEQQTATAEVLQVINSSPGDLAPVFDAILEKALQRCDPAFGIVWRYDDGLFEIVAHRGVPQAFLEARSGRQRPTSPQTTLGQILAGKDIAHYARSDSDALYLSGDPHRITLVTTTGEAHVGATIALRKDDGLLGAITVYRREPRPFTDKQIALLQNFAAQAVIAIENARLLIELRERTDELARSVEELKALSEVGQAVSATLDIGAVLSTILNRSVALTGSDAGAIFRYRRRTRSFRLFEAVGWDDALTEQIRQLDIPEDATRLGNATERRVSVQIPDLERRAGNPLRDITLAAGYRSVLIVPLVGPDRIFGTIVLQRRAPGEFPEASVRLMQTIASQSALAIQNARLFREIAEKSEQLAEASRHKSQFLANMSHELRTPLNAILGYAELLADGIYGELAPRASGVLERVQNNGKHLLALINDVLDLSKIEAGQLVFTLEDYSLAELVQSVVSATEGMARSKGLALTAEVAPGLPTGHADARRLQQVLLNLVGNAVKFTDEGEVAIRAAAEKGNFVLSVRDTGPGIAREDHDKIFGEFQQVDNSNTRKKGGTGLGLAISKRMIEMQGGTISVDSALGEGATFRVVLPIRVEEIIDEAAGASVRDPAPALRGAA